MITPTEAAYIAGIVDGEGCLRLASQARLDIANTSPELINWLQSKVGGKVYLQPQRLGNKPVYRLQLRYSEIKTTLELVLPYMVVKKEIGARILTWLYRKGI